jgi:hypothetical protein
MVSNMNNIDSKSNARSNALGSALFFAFLLSCAHFEISAKECTEPRRDTVKKKRACVRV